ncbi:acetyl-CoA carboxylase biotin carboxyl carrier protein subunit [Pedobacter ginsengisoli]|uniref:Acetyl-CoA carboxylase biotin carboxyl carrier protein subunit n=1 Tax=Pedobacter ginsengisoli TaxID=363852 RepID=A0A2D1U907_9SPHI|nr:acetyl-CoA carboxylase biotin carboxyl carrier protein subunit [Pedobacter ginsengisoli]ATP58103.1 acetyl-CoA carboxylase biotin carboxyl carrier protein subunit [Pedobacter ginsengisoli]
MKVSVNGHYNFDVEINNDLMSVNGVEVVVDAKPLSDTHTHVIYNNKSYNIELVHENKADKTSIIKVNGTTYTIDMEDQYDQLLKQMGMDSGQVSKVSEIKAPMPGLVLSVLVTEGQEVSKGESLIVLEAMKMENVIKSPTSGIIKRILISKADKVEKNELLIQFQ